MTVWQDFKSAPWPIKLLIVSAVIYIFGFVPLIATGYFGTAAQKGFQMFFGVA